MPSSSIVISPTPVSCTMRTTSRIRSARAWSTPPAASESSPPERSRIERSSGSASSPNSASNSSSSSLEARPSGLGAQLVELELVVGIAVAVELDGAAQSRVGGSRRAAEPAVDEVAHLVDHRRVAICRQHVEERLRGHDLADRRGERRRADLLAHARHLVEHLVQPIAGGTGAELLVECADEADRELLLGRAHRDPRRHGCDRLVADVLVDEIGGRPEASQVDAGGEPEAAERLGERLGRDAMHRERDRVDRVRDHVGARACRLERVREPVPAGALRVEPDRQARHLAELRDELAGTVGLQERRRVVQEQPRRTELRQPARGLDERLVLAAAVEKTGFELLACGDDRAAAAARRLSTSFSGSCRRKTSMPLWAALATNRAAPDRRRTGREPTRKRPRRASASGVDVRSFSARMRSHGLSTPRRTAVSKTPPPDTSR